MPVPSSPLPAALLRALLVLVPGPVVAAEPSCPDGPAWRLGASAQLRAISQEGEPYRLSIGRCVGRLLGVPVHVDAVVSHIDVREEGGVPGGRTWALGIEPVMQGRWGRRAYWEFGGGVQATTGVAFPANGSDANFTVFGGLGLRLESGSGREVRLGLRLLHVSNANLLPDNSGYDGIQGYVQLGP